MKNWLAVLDFDESINCAPNPAPEVVKFWNGILLVPTVAVTEIANGACGVVVPIPAFPDVGKVFCAKTKPGITKLMINLLHSYKTAQDQKMQIIAHRSPEDPKRFPHMLFDRIDRYIKMIRNFFIGQALLAA